MERLTLKSILFLSNFRICLREWTVQTSRGYYKQCWEKEAIMEDGHAKTVDEVLNYFNVDSEKGLSLDQVKRNQEKYGLNGKSF